MKRIFIIFPVISVLLLACIYLFIPNKIIISKKVNVAANHEALFRTLSDSANWKNWWPGKKETDPTKGVLSLNGLQYKPGERRTLSLPLIISNKDFRTFIELTFITIDKESTTVNLDGIIPTSYNPIKRIQRFFTARKIKKDINTMFESINSYYSKIEHLYGYDIQKKSVVDSILLFTSKEIKGYPSTEIIYSLIDELKKYIKQQSANETGYPMLNIFTEDNIDYRVKVAIPVDKKLPSSGNISYKWMLGGGNILITEVHGGNSEIEKALNQVQNYISDYNRVAPAISFQSLVTDRRKETDSSKWVTRIYYPVM